jgi:hypothetical protein
MGWVLQPPWPDLEPAAGFKRPSRAVPYRPTDSTSLTNKGSRPSEAPTDHRIVSGDKIFRLLLMPRGLRGFLPSAVALGKPAATNFIAAAISLRPGSPRGKLRIRHPASKAPASLRRQKNRWGGQSKDRHNAMTPHCSFRQCGCTAGTASWALL